MPRRHPILVSLLASAVVLLAACGGGDDDAVRTGTTQRLTTSQGAAPAATTAVGADDGNGEPATIEVTTDDDGSNDVDPDGSDSTSTDSTATGEPDDSTGPAWPSASYRLFEVASLDFPTAMTTRPGSGDLFVAERNGRVRRIGRTTQGSGRPDFTLASTPVADITDLVGTSGEGGLLGIAFSGDGQILYTSYTDRRGDSVVAEYQMSGDSIDPGSARIVLALEQPFSNHNGGQIERGPDGLLWFGLGDGGSGGDPLNSGQDTSTLLGSILRIDPANPESELGYGLPADNPFADGEQGRPEIWLYGVRNPWRFSFDQATDDLWIGDVGQNAVEEVTFIAASGGLPGRGANLGWKLMEGDRSYEGGSAPAGHVGPIYAYDRAVGGCSVTGGYVYRGARIPDLQGVYLFGDYCVGDLVGIDRLDDGSVLVGDLVTDRTAGNIVAFGQDVDGEVYVMGSGGSVSLLEPAG